jgi:hypothetical protein
MHGVEIGTSPHWFCNMATSTTDKSLARFLETVRSNQQRIQKHFPERYGIIKRVDACFVGVGKHLANAKPIYIGPMFYRAQYAYKTAAGMTLAGQCAESFVMMRSCLEYAGYALLIFADPTLEEVFVNRHVDSASKGAQRRKFEITNGVIPTIANFDKQLADIYKALYNLSIEFGGHPNPHGMFTAMNIGKDAEEKMTGMTTSAFANDPKIIEFAMHKAAQVGLTSLYIFQNMLKEKFELLGVRAKLDTLRKEGL